MEKALHYKAEIQAIPLIRRDLEELAVAWSLPGPERRQILLIVEELFSNTIRFAFKDTEEHYIRIQIALKDHHIAMEMIDDGIPFNPMEYNPAYRPDPAAVDDGGMGLTLIKTFADSIEYSRKEERNHLVIRKIIRQ
jgi:serine/threonine-protein kinase RsbW